MIRRYFDNPICHSLPLTDYCSRYFWQTIPVDFHTFNTIAAINNDFEDNTPSEIDSQNSDEVLDEDEEIRPITNDEFQRTSHWYFFNNNEFERNECAICRSEFEEGERITALNCLHQYHTNCVQRWVTEVSGFYIEIKNSLTLALECESRAAIHHFNVGQKLAILHDRLHNDLPRLKNILKEGLSMDLR